MDEEAKTWLAELVAKEIQRIEARIEKTSSSRTRNGLRWELQQALKCHAPSKAAKEMTF